MRLVKQPPRFGPAPGSARPLPPKLKGSPKLKEAESFNSITLMRGLEGAGTEKALAVNAYNLKRVINILGVPALMEMMA